MRALFFRFVPRGSVVLAITTLGSYALGLVRDRIFAQTFGASTSLDAYNAAFLLPDFLFNLLVASGIAAAAVPLFMQLRYRDVKEAHAYMNTIILSAVGVMLLTSIVVFVGAPLLATLVAPGLDEAGRALVVRLMRIVAFSPVLFAASNALGAMLVAEKRFFFYGLSPILYNVGIIGGALWLAPRFGIMGVAYGTLIGAVLHAAIRLIDAVRSGWRWGGSLPLSGPQMRRTVRLMVPKMVGHPVELVTFWVFTSLASLLAVGSITVLNFARNFQSVPVSILGIAMATAVFPALTEAALTSPAQLRALLWRTTGTIALASGAAALLMFVIRRPLVAVLLGGGAFDEGAIERTALILGVFCLAIPTESLSHLFARSFYAMQNTLIPVLWTVVGLVVSVGSAYVLMQPLGLAGLPLGFFLGSAVKTAGLFIVFLQRTKSSVVFPHN
jgi:putative peptidoglycan lipid II flippase